MGRFIVIAAMAASSWVTTVRSRTMPPGASVARLGFEFAQGHELHVRWAWPARTSGSWIGVTLYPLTAKAKTPAVRRISTGHGVGLNIHEAPWIRAHSEERLQTGMITTLEPGIYLPGIGGIRIEKLFLITADGAGSLDKLPVSLDEMVLG